MKINRRDAIKMAGLAAGTAALSPFAATAAGRGGPPMRFVFFIYSNGFHPDHVCPGGLRDMRKTDKLLDVELGPHMQDGPIFRPILPSFCRKAECSAAPKS